MPSYPDHLWSTLVTIPAAISILGSSAMLYVISKSRDKLKTTLHRLLFCLCVADIMMSMAILFSKAVVKFQDRLGPDGEPMYSIPVATNQTACDAQGLFALLGGILSPFYNCALCVYYLCVIKFNYSDTKIKKKIEPYLHAVPWTWASFCAVYALASKSINANRLTCWMEPSPIDCKNPAAGVECERGENAVELRMILQTVPLIAVFFSICGIMAVVYLTVWKQERRMKRYDHRAAASLAGRSDEESMIAGRQSADAARGAIRQNVTNSRKVLNQALAYVGAYLFSFILVFINQFIVFYTKEYNLTILVMSSAIYPLQGFFNFMVFMYPRVSRQMRRNDDMNVFQALLAAVQCKPIPPRRNRNISSTGGEGGANSRLRNISGLRGTPSKYNGCHSSGAANRSGQRAAISPTDAASGLLVSDRSSNGLDTMPKKKISFAGESIADDSKTYPSRSHPPESILRNSICASSFSLKASVEDGVGILPERKLAVVGSTTVAFIPQNYTEESDEREEAEGETDVDCSPENADGLRWEQGARSDDNEDEEVGFFSSQNIRRLSYAPNLSIAGIKVLELISENDDSEESE